MSNPRGLGCPSHAADLNRSTNSPLDMSGVEFGSQ